MKNNWKFRNTPLHIATAFTELYPDVKLSKHLNQFVYYDEKFKWVVDQNNTYLKSLINGEFKFRLECFFENSLQEFKQHAHIINERKNKVLNFLNHSKNIELLIQFISRIAYVDGKFNMNENLILFQNGIYHLRRRKFKMKGYRDFWILDNLEMNIKFEEKNYNKIKLIETNFINKIFPEAEIRECYLQCLANIFSDKKNVKMIVNFNGDAKSMFMDILLNIFGTYGTRIQSDELEKRKIIPLKEIDQKKIIFIESGKKMEQSIIELLKNTKRSFIRKTRSIKKETNINGTIIVNCDDIPKDIINNESIKKNLFIMKFPETDVIMKKEYTDACEFTKQYGAQMVHILLRYYNQRLNKSNKI